MNRFLNYLPLHFVVLCILGICFQFFTQFWTFNFFDTLFLIAFLSLLFLIFKHPVLRTFTSFVLFFFLGVASVCIHDYRIQDTFFEPYLEENSTVILQIHKVLKSGNYNYKYEAKVVKVDDKKTTGKLLLNIKKDTTSKRLNVDELLLLKPVLKEVIPPLNPHQFNYKSYLATQGIYHQIFVEYNQISRLNSDGITFFGRSAKLITFIQESLQKYNFKKNELAVINALILGQRQEISTELITNYQKAGAIHILAVSGLHIGIILLFISFLLTPLERIKYGKFLKTLCIIFLLWVFAFIAGLSASVVRAVTMFTFVAIGMFFGRKNRIEFSLISSMFFLLLMRPMFLFDVGFQLSYLAVFGIVYLQPKIYSLWKPLFSFLDFFWKLCSVSIAAQIAVLPLSIYYFHQFPGLFLVSNLVIIPFLGIILIGGVLLIFLSIVNLLPQCMADFYGTIISFMNAFVSWISHRETFLFTEVIMSFTSMLCCYLFLFFGFYFLFVKSFKSCLCFLSVVLLCQIIFLLELNEKKLKKEFIIFHKSHSSVIGYRNGEQLFLQKDLNNGQLQKQSFMRTYQTSENISDVHLVDFKNYIQFANKDILLIDHLGIYKNIGVKNPIIVLQHSPKINLQRLINTVHPSKIIADGSNYKREVLRWENSCLKNNIPFYNTAKKGAFILRE
jgi:competence protein ComEC